MNVLFTFQTTEVCTTEMLGREEFGKIFTWSPKSHFS